MTALHPTHFLIVGAGATGLVTARELARAGKKATILEARGTTFAIAHRGCAMECPQRRVLAGRVSASSCGSASPSLEGVENRSTYRRVPVDAFCRSAIQ